MNSISFAFLFAAALLQAVSAQVPINGTCDGYCKGNGTKNPSDYLGIWYLQQYTPNLISEKFKCAYLNASSVEGGMLIASMHSINILTGKRQVESSNIEFFPNGTVSLGFTNYDIPVPFEIIASSSDYFVSFLCTECGLYSKEGAGLYGSVYTRINQPECETTDSAVLNLTSCGIPKNALKLHDHSNCKLC